MRYEMNTNQLREAISTTHNMLKCFDPPSEERSMLCEHLDFLLKCQRNRASVVVTSLKEDRLCGL